jgi:hypothetical protein
VSGAPVWPEVNVALWAPTKHTLHMLTQMLGKLRVALSPAQPEWMFTALHLTARGVTTGTMPWQDGAVQASLDVYASEVIVEHSDGRTQRIPLVPARTLAEIWADLSSALHALGVDVKLWPIPQEVPDVTPFDTDRRPAAYDPAAAQSWLHVSTAVAGIFERWRAHFFGRSGIQLWWGAFDVALLLFNGKHVQPPADRGYLMKYDLDTEMMNAGLYFGDETTAPFFYSYIYPPPANAAQLPIAPATATWSDAIKEWVLPYDAVRTAADPTAELNAFLDAVYALCGSAAGWDRAALSYVPPKRPAHR